MERIKNFVKKHFSVLALIVVVVTLPLMVAGCSLSGGDKATPTPVANQPSVAQIIANISRIDTGLAQVITRVSLLETNTAGIATSNARLIALENQVGAMNMSSLIASLTIAQSQIAQLQADMIVANNRIVSLIALVNGSGGATPTPTPTGTTPTPTPSATGLVVTVSPLFAGAVKDATTYSYTFSVKNNFTSAKTFKLVADYSSNTMSANVNVSSTTIVSAEVISGFTKLFSPSTGNGCGLIRFTSSDLVIPAGGTLNINAEFTLVYTLGSPTTVWTCAITTQ